MSNDFTSFSELPLDLQREAIREGEARLSAQLSVAGDADKRALTWGGFLLTGSTVLLGSGFSLVSQKGMEGELAIGALLWGSVLLFSAFLALWSARPKQFNLPGNRPGNWLPQYWDCFGTDKAKIRVAMSDQARHLDKMIRENSALAEANGELMNWSFGVSLFSVFASAIILLLYTLS